MRFGSSQTQTHLLIFSVKGRKMAEKLFRQQFVRDVIAYAKQHELDHLEHTVQASRLRLAIARDEQAIAELRVNRVRRVAQWIHTGCIFMFALISFLFTVLFTLGFFVLLLAIPSLIHDHREGICGVYETRVMTVPCLYLNDPEMTSVCNAHDWILQFVHTVLGCRT